MVTRNSVRFALCALALGGFSLSSYAAYAQLAPPPGWSQGAGGASMYHAANGEKWLQSTVRTNAALNVGGRAVQVGAAMRLAVNAPQYVAGRLAAGAVGGPGGLVAAGLTVGAMMAIPVVADWLFGAPTPLRWDAANSRFEERNTLGGYSWWNGDQGPYGSPEETTSFAIVGNASLVPQITCTLIAGGMAANCYLNGVPAAGPEKKLNTQEKWEPVPTERLKEAIESLGYSPLPANFPNAVPMPYPVQNPIVNPSPDVVPLPQPLSIPLGDPVPVPNTNPQQYSQPVARVAPSPTPQNPWRVDVREEEVVSTSPDGVPDPTPTEGSPETKPEEQKDFCEKNPTSVVCAEMDSPEAEIPADSEQIAYQAENLFGTGSCPANLQTNLSTLNQVVTVWDWQKTCEMALPLRALVIALASFAAFLIVMPGETRV